jgi:hypothetical protein
MTAKPSPFRQIPRNAIAFRPEFLDFKRGIRVGNLEDNARITRLLKLELEYLYRQTFVTQRWGRGVYWHWIGFLPKANRLAKPISNSVNFGCAKFFVTLDVEDQLFKCGLQIERGFVKAPPEYGYCELRPDWDWQRLLQALKRRSPMEKEIHRLLLHEDFRIHAGDWEGESADFMKSNLPDAVQLHNYLTAAPGDHWAGFQLYYPMRESEVKRTPGLDLIESMLAIFHEVTPAMNRCMQIELNRAT